MKEVPDSFVPERRSKSYPTEIGSPNFSPDNISLFKLEKTHKIKNHFTNKFAELQSEYDKLMNQIQINERLYKATYNFEPIPGENYYLYKKESTEFLSIISPKEWNFRYEFIGKFQIQTNGLWQEIKD